MQRAQPPVQRLVVEALGDRGGPRLGDRDPPADPLESPLDPGDVEQLEHGQPGNGAAIRADPAAPLDQVLAAAVGRYRLAAQFGREFDDGVLRRSDERAAEVDGHACDRRGRRPAADAVAALQHDDVVSELDQLPRRGQPRKPGPDDDDIGVGCLLFARALIGGGCVTRLGSHAVKVMTALFGPINAIEQARAFRDAGASGVFTFEGTTRCLHAAHAGIDRRRPRPDDQRRNRVSAQPDSSRPPGNRPSSAQRRPVRARTGHPDPHADREAVRRASSTSRWPG